MRDGGDVSHACGDVNMNVIGLLYTNETNLCSGHGIEGSDVDSIRCIVQERFHHEGSSSKLSQPEASTRQPNPYRTIRTSPATTRTKTTLLSSAHPPPAR